MSITSHIMAGGIPAPAAAAISGLVADGLTATGATQATAFPIGVSINAFSTVTASTGAVLPISSVPGDQIVIFNGGASTLTVYPPLGGTINNLAVNTGLALVTLKSGFYTNRSGLGWFSTISA